jgi:hypothetical protein
LANNEYIEYIIKYILTETLRSNDVRNFLFQWNVRFTGLLFLKLIITERTEIFIEKLFYAKKIIQTFIIHSKDHSEKISNLATQVYFY